MKKPIFTFLLVAVISIALHAQTVNLDWVKQIGGPATEAGAIAVHSNGDVYTAGVFQSTVDFDPGGGIANLTAPGVSDIFVSKLDVSGNFLWAKQIGGGPADVSVSYAITLDASGNVYITGSFRGTVDFDPGGGTTNLTSTGGLFDIFVLKLDASGNFVWVSQMGGSADDESLAIALDVSGNVYTTGYFSTTADFDPGVGNAPLTVVGDLDIFVSKLDASGNYQWAVQMGGLARDFGTAIRIHPDGDVVSTGIFSGVADLDPTGSAATFTAPGAFFDTYVSKLLATTGGFVWAQQIGGTATEQINAVAIDALGNIYTTGFFDGTTDFNPDPTPGTGDFNLTTNGGRDIFISKLSSTGGFVWAKNIGNPGNSGAGDRDIGIHIAVDASSNVYTTGSFANTADFNPDPAVGAVFNLVSAGERDIFISVLNSSGDFVLARQFGDVSFDQGVSVALNSTTGNIHIGGWFVGTIDFDPGSGIVTLTSNAGSQDIFVLKLSQLLAVPLSLVDFIAKLTANQTVQLQWRTASEENTSRFEIEKSINGTSFANVGTVKAAGNSSSIKNYSFSDQQPFSGNNYYRLKMIDADGKFTYSKVVVVRMNSKTTLQVFPTPAKNVLYVQATGNNKNSLLRITDAAGKIVKEEKVILNGTTSFSVDISSLPKGLYYLTLKDASKIQQQKIIKQ